MAAQLASSGGVGISVRCQRPLKAIAPPMVARPCSSSAGSSAAPSWHRPRLGVVTGSGGAGPTVPPPVVHKGPITGATLADLHGRLKKLQNGSDIRGVALDGGPGQPVTLTPGIAFFIGHAFATWLHTKEPGAQAKVSVGRDPRLSGQVLETALLAGLAAGGALPTSFGIATTPCMFYSVISSQERADHAAQLQVVGKLDETYDATAYTGAIMLTASHMPWHNNGLKLFTRDGGLNKNGISELLQLAATAAGAAGVALGDNLSESQFLLPALTRLPGNVIRHFNFLPLYAAHLRELIKAGINSKERYHLPLAGFKIVVDAGNGSGGFYAEQVLAPLGADVRGSQFLDPDGSFPNHIPNPEAPEAMAAGSAAVKAVGADLGIVFDTDVDRSAIVDRSGREINSNRFIALMAAIVLREELAKRAQAARERSKSLAVANGAAAAVAVIEPRLVVVTDSVTSNGLTPFIEAQGGNHLRFKRGYKNVIDKGVEINSGGGWAFAPLMMETSGHGALAENHYLDDGAYMATKVVIELARRRQAGQGDVSELLASLTEPLEAKEVRIKILDSDFKKAGGKALEAFHAAVLQGAHSDWTLEAENFEGWRVIVDEGANRRGWVLLRQSLHDPLLVLNMESDTKGGVAESASRVLQILKQAGSLPLDLSGLEAAAGPSKAAAV